MSRISSTTQRQLRTLRSRTKLKGDSKRPRLSVRVSNKTIDAQVINDTDSKTIVGAKMAKKDSDKLVAAIASGLKEKKIKHLVLDRGPKQYHGVIATVADGLRKEGINL